MDRKRTLLTIAVVVLVVFSGCVSMGNDGGDAAGGDGGDADFAAENAGGDGGDGGGEPQSRSSDGGDGGDGGDAGQVSDGQAPLTGQAGQIDRAIIRTGTVRLRVDDFATARGSVGDRARQLGGYVDASASTRHTRDNETWTTGYVVVRVPSDRFSDVLTHARDRGTVLNEEMETEDVTDKLVDLDARLTNLEQRRDRLRSFYEQANSTQELLRIEQELSSVQSEIERVEAQKRSLEDRVAFATLRVELAEPQPESGPVDPNSDTTLAAAFLGSIATLIDLGYGLLLLTVRLVPFVLVLGLPIFAVGLFVRRRMRDPGSGWQRADSTDIEASAESGGDTSAESGGDTSAESSTESTVGEASDAEPGGDDEG